MIGGFWSHKFTAKYYDKQNQGSGKPSTTTLDKKKKSHLRTNLHFENDNKTFRKTQEQRKKKLKNATCQEATVKKTFPKIYIF